MLIGFLLSLTHILDKELLQVASTTSGPVPLESSIWGWLAWMSTGDGGEVEGDGIGVMTWEGRGMWGDGVSGTGWV